MRRTRSRRRKSPAARAAELSIAAPQVVALRTARMLSAGAAPGARDRREMTRMGVEKAEAAWESMNAMALQLVRAQQDFALFALRQWWTASMSPWSALSWWSVPRLQQTASRILDAGMGPVHRRATANARRLRRPKAR